MATFSHKQTKRLVLSAAVIASSVLVVPNALAARQVVNADAAINADGIADGLDFQTDNTLTVADGTNVGATDSVSAINSAAGDSNGTIKFSGTSTVTGSVTPTGDKLGTLDLNGDNTKKVTLQGNVVVNEIKLTNGVTNSTLSLTDGVDVTASKITTALNGTGKLEILGTSTVNADIGEAGKLLSDIDAAGGAGKTATFTGNILVNNITVSAPGTAIFQKGFTVGNTLQVNAGGTATVMANSTAPTANIFGTLNLGQNLLTSATDFRLQANSTLAVNLGGLPDPAPAVDTNGNFGQVNASAGGVSVLDATGTVAVTNTAPIANGTVYSIILSNGGGIPNVPGVSGNTPTYTYTLASPGNNLELTVARRNLTDSGAVHSNPSLGGLLGSLDNLVNSGGIASADPALVNAVNSLEALPNSAQINQSAETMTPFADGALWAGSVSSVFNGINTVANHLYSLRLPTNDPNFGTSFGRGFDGGDGWKKYPSGTWGQFLGKELNQSERNGVSGFDGYQLGLAIGHDWDFRDNFKLGLAFNYNYTDIDSRRLGDSETEINTYHGILYGSYYFNNCPMYLDAAASVAYHDYDTQRNVVVFPAGPATAANYKAEGSFNAWQYNLWAELGYQWWEHSWLFVPHIYGQYSHLNIDEYGETGAAGLNLTNIDYDNMSAAILGAGLRLGYMIRGNNCSALPYAKLAFGYDFENDAQVSTSTLTGGGAPFVTTGPEPDRKIFTGAVGVDWQHKGNMFFTVKYEVEGREDYYQHGGYVRFRYHWQ